MAMEDMYAAMQEMELRKVERGDVVEGVLVEPSGTGWLVDIGYKSEGYLNDEEMTMSALVEEGFTPEKDQKVKVRILSMGKGDDSQILVSRARAIFDERWNDFQNMIKDTDIINVKGLRKVKGGLIVDCCGIEGFIPNSHLALPEQNVSSQKLIGEQIEVKVLEKDRRKKRIVLSRKAILEEERKKELDGFFERVHEGDVVDGRVTGITNFGVFVDLGGMEGLVHLSELGWGKNVRPRDVAKKGELLQVKVLGIDTENRRISLSIKDIQNNPWDEITEKIKVDDIMKGKVTNITDFGVFVELLPGIEGLIHVGDLSWQRIGHPKEVIKKGSSVDVLVMGIDTNEKRISLGYKQINDPWKAIDDKYREGETVTGQVTKVMDFGAFVELEKGVEGLIHISHLSRKRVEKTGDILKEGQDVTAKVIEVTPDKRRIRLSIRAIEEDDERKRRDEERSRRKSDHEKQHNTFQEDFNITLGQRLKE